MIAIASLRKSPEVASVLSSGTPCGQEPRRTAMGTVSRPAYSCFVSVLRCASVSPPAVSLAKSLAAHATRRAGSTLLVANRQCSQRQDLVEAWPLELVAPPGGVNRGDVSVFALRAREVCERQVRHCGRAGGDIVRELVMPDPP
jgi:hypothetical protein